MTAGTLSEPLSWHSTPCGSWRQFYYKYDKYDNTMKGQTEISQTSLYSLPLKEQNTAIHPGKNINERQ